MTALTWAIRLIIFSILLVFAIQNTDLAPLRLLPGLEWQVPQIVSMLGFFVAGSLLGVFSVLGFLFKQRQQISLLKQALSQRDSQAENGRQPSL